MDMKLVKLTVEFPRALDMVEFVERYLLPKFQENVSTLTMDDHWGSVLTWEMWTEDPNAYMLDMWENAQLVTWNKAHLKFGYNDAEHIGQADNYANSTIAMDIRKMGEMGSDHPQRRGPNFYETLLDGQS